MAIFGWGKKGDADKAEPKGAEAVGGAASTTPVGGGAVADSGFSADKARKWFEGAQKYHDMANYEYAMLGWLSGLRFDPTSVEGLASFFKTSAAYYATGAKGVSKQLQSAIKGSGDVDKYLNALLAWSAEPSSADAAVRATQAAAKLGLHQSVAWIAPKALALCAQAERPRKGDLVMLMETFHAAGSNELAVSAGELALRIDPSDNNLRADVRDLAAQASIDKGGYDKSGEAGGFRSNVKDLDKQRKLEEAERIVKTEDQSARVIAEAKAAYTANPQDRPLIKGYMKALLDRGTRTDEDEAIKVAEKAYKDTQEFMFRKFAGDVRMRQGRNQVRELKAAADAHPNDAVAAMKYRDALTKQVELEITEYEALVSAYPTDLRLKYELGIRLLEAQRYEPAIEQLQQARNDGQLKLKALFALGLSFHHLGWEDEAVETFRSAIAGIADLSTEPMSKDIRYALMVSLQKIATDSKDVGAAEEAGKLAQAIGMEQITYKDIRQRRDQIKALIAQLRQGT